MIAKLFIRAARAAAICLLIAGVAAGGQLIVAPPAHAQNAPTPPTMPGVPTLPGTPTTGPQMPTVKVAPGKGDDKDMTDEDDKNRPKTSPVFEFLKHIQEKAGAFFKQGGGFLPIMLTPLRVAAMLVFLVYYIGFHFKRNERMRREAELEAQANEPKVPILPEEE
jgi:hypothetical protein